MVIFRYVHPLPPRSIRLTITCCPALSPDLALVLNWTHHGVALSAIPRFGKSRHIRKRSVHTEAWEGVRVHGDQKASKLGSDILGPDLRVAEKKPLVGGEAINLRLRFRFWRLLEGGISNRQAAQVGNALTQHQLAVLMKLVFNNVAVELFLNALSPLLEPFQIIGRPPVHQVSMRIKLASLIVKTMRHFMSDHRTHCAIVDGVIGVGIEERRLKNASWKHDLVHRRIVIGIHGGRRHSHSVRSTGLPILFRSRWNSNKFDRKTFST